MRIVMSVGFLGRCFGIVDQGWLSLSGCLCRWQRLIMGTNCLRNSLNDNLWLGAHNSLTNFSKNKSFFVYCRMYFFVCKNVFKGWSITKVEFNFPFCLDFDFSKIELIFSFIFMINQLTNSWNVSVILFVTLVFWSTVSEELER